MNKIKYRKGYKYQLARDYTCWVEILPDEIIQDETGWITLEPNGKLTIRSGYAWDGPSGPTIDTPTFMRGSLIHDALYQLIRQGLLEPEWREQADKELRIACIQDGMMKCRAWYVFWAVHYGAAWAADPANKKKIIEAP